MCVGVTTGFVCLQMKTTVIYQRRLNGSLTIAVKYRLPEVHQI